VIRVAIALLLFCANTAWAELEIKITRALENATPIAIVPMQWSGVGPAPEDIAKIISDDLYGTGQFKPLDRQQMLSMPSQESEVFFRDWRVLDLNYLVVGKFSTDPVSQSFQLQFELFNVLNEKRVELATVKSTNARDLAHYASDIIFERITGVRGAFRTKLLYVTVAQGQRGQVYRLHRSDADGHGEITILESPEPILSPAWAPDVKKIAYVSFQEHRPAIYIQELATGRQEKIAAFPGLNGAPSFSPDGTKLAMVLSKDGNPEIYVMDLATRNLRRLTDHFAIDTEPSWFPDGRSLLFTSNRGGGPQIYSVDLSGGSVKRITYDGDYNARASLSADGRYLVLVHRANDRFHIAVQDMQRGSLRMVSETDLDESPSIAPNGMMIIYSTQSRNNQLLAEVSLDGRVKMQLPAVNGDVREPAWSPYLQ
jgi:TolB protein